MKALWNPTGTQQELSQIIDDILRVDGFDSVDPIVLGSHITKEKGVSEKTSRAMQTQKTIYPWNLSNKWRCICLLFLFVFSLGIVEKASSVGVSFLESRIWPSSEADTMCFGLHKQRQPKML